MRTILLFTLCLASILSLESCDDTPLYRDSNGRPYTNDVYSINLSDENDCTLPRCDPNRIRRLFFDEVHGILYNDSTIQIYGGIDGLYVLMLCDKKITTFPPETEVIVTGSARDACPYYTQQFCCDMGFFFTLDEIREY